MPTHFLNHINKAMVVCAMAMSVFMLTACDPSRIFEDNIEIEDMKWDMNSPVSFQVPIADTSARYNVYLNVRNSGHYQFSNIYLFVNTTLPDNSISRDTVEITLADPDGKWRGKGLGDIWDNRFLFKDNLQFPLTGDYRFDIFQAMRVEVLPNIMDIGIRIEKAQH